jgi:hypothetical protein
VEEEQNRVSKKKGRLKEGERKERLYYYIIRSRLIKLSLFELKK